MSFSLSVVMSVYNGQAFLAQAIESIVNQTFRDFEFVIIDDGSTDHSAEIVAQYNDPRIRIFRQVNKGRAASLNTGINLAQSNLIARMDADDIALPHRFEKQIAFMKLNPQVGVLGGAFELIDVSGNVFSIIRPPLSDADIKKVMLRSNPISHPSVVMRKDVALASGGYRAPLLDADDYDLFLRMGERSEIANLAEPILQYRIHANQVTVKNMRHQIWCVFAASYAAELRRVGQPDPLSEITEITPQLLAGLGISEGEVDDMLADGYRYWIEILAHSNPEASFRLVDELLKLADVGHVKSPVLADGLLRGASVYYRNGKRAKAVLLAAHAVTVSPAIGKRLLRKVLNS